MTGCAVYPAAPILPSSYETSVTFVRHVRENSNRPFFSQPVLNIPTAGYGAFDRGAMTKYWDAEEWWERTDRLYDMFNAYRDELLKINAQIAEPLDIKTIVKIGGRVNRIQWRIQMLESMIRRHLARAPHASAQPSCTPAAEIRLH